MMAPADEVWTTKQGDIVYESELNGVAILSIPTGSGPATIYVPGLAGNYDHRSIHTGFWIGDGAAGCDAMLTGPDGRASHDWGRVIVKFDNEAYPTDMTIVFGVCFDRPKRALHGSINGS